MTSKTAPPGDDRQVRCPRLGQQIVFSYCRKENRGLPCFKILDCWHRQFAVASFLRAELSPEEWQQAFNRPRPPKILSLVELIAQAQKSKKRE